MIKEFISGFLSVFRFGTISVKHMKTRSLDDLFISPSEDMGAAYKKIVKAYERK